MLDEKTGFTVLVLRTFRFNAFPPPPIFHVCTHPRFFVRSFCVCVYVLCVSNRREKKVQGEGRSAHFGFPCSRSL
jgi:hypothetical protein